MFNKTLFLLALCSGVGVPCAAQPVLAPVPTVVITGNPLQRDLGARAASQLSGPELLLRRAATLGETLDGLPGVAGSGFGPNSNRPVIRGLDGDRVRVLDNAGAAVDASNLSFDHAVALDPLVAERIEVLRGPASLLYGGNATGGVVNVIDNRIPRVPGSGLSGRAELRLGGASKERSGAAVLEGGEGRLAWHADVAGRQADNQRTPRFTPLEDGVALQTSREVRNSAARSQAGAVGAGWVSDQGYLGVAIDTMRNRYGVTVEPDILIRMQRDRLTLAGEWRAAEGWLRSVNARAGHTRYRHEEVEGSGEVGTTFSSRGQDLRLEARHAPWAGVEGVWGVQTEALNFSALGTEAFVPGTRTRSRALFVLEELKVRDLALSVGGRAEQVQVSSDGDLAGAPEPKFGDPASRRFSPSSLSLAARIDMAPGWQLQASAGTTQRAPAYYELYANGVHVATAAFELGDPRLGLERSRHLELGLAWRSGAHSLKASVFSTHFANFISLDATGAEITIPGASGEPDTVLPEYRFQGVRARLRGAEIEGRTRLLQGSLTLDLSGSVDLLRGDNLSVGEPLPRLSPTRARLGLEAGLSGLHAGVDVRYAARQLRFSSNDTATAGATLLDLWARGSLWGGPQAAGSSGSWFAKLANATDELAFNPVAVATVRGLSPLPGRSLLAGVQVRW